MSNFSAMDLLAEVVASRELEREAYDLHCRIEEFINQPAAGEPVEDVITAFEEAWSQAMCNDEGVPGPKPLRSLIDPQEYRGGGVKFAWRWFQRGALSAAPPAAAHGDAVVPNLVPGLQWAIDYCKAMQRQGNDRMLVEVIRKRLENVRDNQPTAMRARGDGE